jgi:hypothetical protein
MKREGWPLICDGSQGAIRDERYQFDWVPRSDAEVKIEKAKTDERERIIRGLDGMHAMFCDDKMDAGWSTAVEAMRNIVGGKLHDSKPLDRVDLQMMVASPTETFLADRINEIIERINEMNSRRK